MIYELLIMTIGWLYPAFATYNTLNGNLRAQLPWMKYWIVFGVFNAFHFFTVCMEPYVPFLSGFKVLVLCWLLPSIGCGSQLIHDEVVDPLLTNNRETINQTVDRISSVSSTLMRELIKMIYHLMVDVVEQFWLMTRNANDINVTPRLQMAINEAILDEYHEVEQLEEDGEPLPIADTPGAFQAAAFDALPNDPSSLSVLLAESREAKHLQLLQLVNGQMHLVSSKQTSPESGAAAMPQRPLKPKRGKRKSLEAAAQRAQQLQLEMEVERAYQEYCAAAQEHEQHGGEKVAEQH